RTTAGAALAAELPDPDARLELAVLQIRNIGAEPVEERGVESRTISGRGCRALRRLPYAAEHLWRRQALRGFWRRHGAGQVRAEARFCRTRRAEILERGGYRRIS